MRLKTFLSIVASIAVLFIGLSSFVLANNVKSAANVTIATNEVVDGDLFVSGEVVTIEGVVNGDVFAAGQHILVKGTINGDIYGAARSVEITGRVRDDVLLAAQSISFIQAEIGDGAIMLAETAIIDKGTSFGGGLLCALRSLVGNGAIGRGVTCSAETTTINNSVNGDVRVDTRNLTLGQEADVQGSVFYKSNQDARVESGAIIGGNIERTAHDPGNPAAGLLKLLQILIVWAYLSALASGVVLLLFAKKVLVAVADQIPSNFLPTLGWGALILLLALPVFMVLLITIIGIPLALVWAASLFVAIYIGELIVGLALGRWLLTRFSAEKQNPNVYASFVVGISFYYLLKLIPGVNILAILVVISVGVGAMAIAIKNSLAPNKAKK